MVSATVLKRWTSPKYASLLEYGGSYAGAYLLRRGLFMPWELPNVLDGDLARAGWQELQPTRTREVAVERSEEHTSELQSLAYLVCRLLLEKKKKKNRETCKRHAAGHIHATT